MVLYTLYIVAGCSIRRATHPLEKIIIILLDELTHWPQSPAARDDSALPQLLQSRRPVAAHDREAVLQSL